CGSSLVSRRSCIAFAASTHSVLSLQWRERRSTSSDSLCGGVNTRVLRSESCTGLPIHPNFAQAPSSNFACQLPQAPRGNVTPLVAVVVHYDALVAYPQGPTARDGTLVSQDCVANRPDVVAIPVGVDNRPWGFTGQRV